MVPAAGLHCGVARKGWRTVTWWVDSSDPSRIADPETALEDCREAHRWATEELATVAPDSIRGFNLQKERVRLAGIFAALKKRVR